MPTSSPLEALATLQSPLGKKDTPVLQRAIDTMAHFSEECLRATETTDAKPLQAVLQKVCRKTEELLQAKGIPQEDIAVQFSTVQEDYRQRKIRARQQLGITKAREQQAQTRTIANVCATLHAQLLALAEAMKAQENAASEEAKVLPAPSGHGDTGFQLGPKPPADDLAFPFDDLTEDLPEGPTSSR